MPDLEERLTEASKVDKPECLNVSQREDLGRIVSTLMNPWTKSASARLLTSSRKVS